MIFQGVIRKIKTILRILLIEEITLIKTIEVIGSSPDQTPKGSAGGAFRQADIPAGAWVSPTSFEDPDSKWTDEAMLYDTNTATRAKVTTIKDEWCSFVILKRATTTSNMLRLYCDLFTIDFTLVDIDVYKDGAWVHVYEGGMWDSWQEFPFSQGSVTQIRIRGKAKTTEEASRAWNEIYLWALGATGGEIMAKPFMPSTVVAGSKTITLGGSAEGISTNKPLENSCLIQAKATNTGNIFIGNSTVQPYVLEPGDACVVVCANLNLVYIYSATTGEGVNYIGS